jgi:hypothetical protein
MEHAYKKNVFFGKLKSRIDFPYALILDFIFGHNVPTTINQSNPFRFYHL